MKFENLQVFNFEGAFRGMRNPMNSWNKSDSDFTDYKLYIGSKDLELAQRLIRAGSEHRKFMRQIIVSVDITAPLYYWKEFDTYKVGTVANSTSTMHKLATTPITLDCFEIDDYDEDLAFNYLDYETGKLCENDMAHTHVDLMVGRLLENLEALRLTYLETNDKKYWKELIRWLPESWLQTRTITMNYENIFNIIHQRSNHKLTEWSESTIDFFHSLPYANELLFLEENNEN